MKSWQVVRYGKPSEALELVELPSPEPGPEQVRLRVLAAPANFNDVDGCYGRYATVQPPLPYSLGMEAMGVRSDSPSCTNRGSTRSSVERRVSRTRRRSPGRERLRRGRSSMGKA